MLFESRTPAATAGLAYSVATASRLFDLRGHCRMADSRLTRRSHVWRGRKW